MTNLFNPPPTANLPLSLGKDVVVAFRNKVPGAPPGTYTDFPEEVSVKLVIGKGSTEIEAAAIISGSSATCQIESTLADKVKAGTLWRVVVTTPSSDTVPLNGKVVRADGA
jgi:hypothetical protein